MIPWKFGMKCNFCDHYVIHRDGCNEIGYNFCSPLTLNKFKHKYNLLQIKS